MEEKLSASGFGEAWLAAHRKTGERRVFKFCYETENLRALQREITLFRLLKEELGQRDDITRILDWSFKEPPYFIESEYPAAGNLFDWIEEKGGFQQVPAANRLEIVVQAAEALAAAHSVGVLHRDVQPGNILIIAGRDGRPRAQLSDFGIGLIVDRERLASTGITVLGMTLTMEEAEALEATTQLYTEPEVADGEEASEPSDVYALGVVLYQLMIGDFSRAPIPGWRREIEDELLCDDIAAAVDPAPERRLSDARELAERAAVARGPASAEVGREAAPGEAALGRSGAGHPSGGAHWLGASLPDLDRRIGRSSGPRSGSPVFGGCAGRRPSRSHRVRQVDELDLDAEALVEVFAEGANPRAAR